MAMPFLDIQPLTLKFAVQLKKQSSCMVVLTNTTHHDYVAFKVKTTSPKKYCVRPNVGIVAPNSSCEFTVIMQAFKEPPPDMICKDKFLIQSMAVPAVTTDEDITASLFSKGEGKLVQENKLKVTLVSASDSPELSPLNGTLKQGPTFEGSILRDRVFSQPDETLSPPRYDGEIVKEPTRVVRHEEVNPTKIVDDVKDLRPPKKSSVSFVDSLGPENDVKQASGSYDAPKLTSDEDAGFKRDGIKPRIKTEVTRKPVDLGHAAEVNSATKDGEVDRLMEIDIEEMKVKIDALESKLKQADSIITKLIEERTLSYQQSEILQRELVEVRREKVIKREQVGFPLVFVCMVAFIGIVLGYRLHH